jgi:hypothetical protein
MHSWRLFNVLLVGLLVAFVGCTPKPKSPFEESAWMQYATRHAAAGVLDNWQDTSNRLGLMYLESIKESNPNAVCPFGEDRGKHVDTLIQRLKPEVEKLDKEQEEKYRRWERDDVPGMGGMMDQPFGAPPDVNQADLIRDFYGLHPHFPRNGRPAEGLEGEDPIPPPPKKTARELYQEVIDAGRN